jgi:hypothetical protein
MKSNRSRILQGVFPQLLRLEAAADPAQELRAIRVEVAELKRRIDALEARGCDRFLVRLNAPNISSGDEKAGTPPR